MTDVVFRQDDTCPACGSSNVVEGLSRPAHGGEVWFDGCASCQKVWERETRANVANEPCSNCAWLPGSPEAESGMLYGLINDTIEGPGLFYCHRRVPFSVAAGEQRGFEHAVTGDGRRCTNAPVCAGWIKTKLKWKQIR